MCMLDCTLMIRVSRLVRCVMVHSLIVKLLCKFHMKHTRTHLYYYMHVTPSYHYHVIVVEIALADSLRNFTAWPQFWLFQVDTMYIA